MRRSKFLAVITKKYTTMALSLLLLFFGLQFVSSEIHADSAENSLPGLELKRIERKVVEGCWKDHDQVLPVCFHISNKLMRVTHSPSGNTLALYYTNRIGSIHYTQALGTGLLRYKSMDIRVPRLASIFLLMKAIKRKVKKLSSGTQSLRHNYIFLKQIQRRNKNWALLKKTERKVFTKNEAAALQKISSALRKHPLHQHFPKAVQRFHLFCLGLIRSLGQLGSYEKQPWPSSYENQSHDFTKAKGQTWHPFYRPQKLVSENVIAPRSPVNETRQNGQHRGLGNHDNDSTNQEHKLIGCQDRRRGSDRKCFGMCGAQCWCWDWLCGDCCLHQGCLQHDACCRHANPEYLSTYCLLPFIYGFDCKRGYKGYPKCLRNNSYFIYV